MARQNRKDIFDPGEISVVHCIQRAVRRAMLCGVDKNTGKSYEHRKKLIQDRLEYLAGAFGIDVLGYAIMGNHLHVILRNRPDVVKVWSDEEVAMRWWKLFPKRKDKEGNVLEPRESDLLRWTSDKKVQEELRSRLSDVSWLMRCLAENIARQANKEDDCTGRFWEGRFKCQPLLDEAAILACSAYVDLNPVRAKIAETPEKSDFTSAQDRIVSAQAEKRRQKQGKRRQPASRRDGWLAPVYLNEREKPGPKPSRSGRRASDKGFLAMELPDYLQLLDWTGREFAKGKRGRIPKGAKPILERIGLSKETWLNLVKDFGKLFKRVVGNSESMHQYAQARQGHHMQSSGGERLLSGTT